jgi:hypothetical protein
MVHPIFERAGKPFTNDGNTTLAISDVFPRYLEVLNAELAKRNMRLGKLISDKGYMALVFELENGDGKVMEKSVIRIEPGNSTKAIDSAAAIERIANIQVKGDAADQDSASPPFEANIVPRAEEWSDLSVKDVLESFTVINADGQLGSLRDLTRDGQFMRLPGVDVPVFSDINGLDGFGSIKEYTEENKLDLQQILDKKASQADVARYWEQKEKLGNAVRDELRAANIDFGDVPTQQEGAVLTPLNERELRRE